MVTGHGTSPQSTDLIESQVEVARILCLWVGESAVHDQLLVYQCQEVGVSLTRTQPHQLDLVHSHLAAVSNGMGAGERR